MTALATLDDLKDRLDWTLDTDEERIAAAALEDASELARYYGGNDWVSPDSAPRLVRTLILRACKRYMDRPGGHIQSRAGDESVTWGDSAGSDAGTVYFSQEEQALLRSLGGNGSRLLSMQISAYGPQRAMRPGMVPVDYGGDAFPFYASQDGPW